MRRLRLRTLALTVVFSATLLAFARAQPDRNRAAAPPPIPRAVGEAVTRHPVPAGRQRRYGVMLLIAMLALEVIAGGALAFGVLPYLARDVISPGT